MKITAILAAVLLLTTQSTNGQLTTIATTLGNILPGANNPAAAAPSSSSGCGSNEPCTGDTPLTPAQVYALGDQNNQGIGVDSSQSQYFPPGQGVANFDNPQNNNGPAPTFVGTQQSAVSQTLPALNLTALEAAIAALTSAGSTSSGTSGTSLTGTLSSVGLHQSTGTSSSGAQSGMTSHHALIMSAVAGVVAVVAYVA